jgi:hypothetical protein
VHRSGSGGGCGNGVGGELGWRRGHAPVRDGGMTTLLSSLLTWVWGRGGILLALRGEWRRWGGGLTGVGFPIFSPSLLSLSPLPFSSLLSAVTSETSWGDLTRGGRDLVSCDG